MFSRRDVLVRCILLFALGRSSREMKDVERRLVYSILLVVVASLE